MAKPQRPSERTIKKQIRKLREIVDTSKDPIATRLAYTVENALRWMTEETTWGGNFPVSDVANETENLRKELRGKVAND